MLIFPHVEHSTEYYCSMKLDFEDYLFSSNWIVFQNLNQNGSTILISDLSYLNISPVASDYYSPKFIDNYYM